MRNKIEKVERGKIEKVIKSWKEKNGKVRKNENEEKVPVDRSGAIHNVRNPIKYEEIGRNKGKNEK